MLGNGPSYAGKIPRSARDDNPNSLTSTLVMHRFWGLADPQAAMVEYAMFMKNAALLGGALLITQLGSGPLSLRR